MIGVYYGGALFFNILGIWACFNSSLERAAFCFILAALWSIQGDLERLLKGGSA